MTLAISTLNAKYIHYNLALKILDNDLNNHHLNHDMLVYTIKDDLDKISNELAQYDILGLACYIWNIEQIKYLITQLRKLNPQQTIILGGPEVSFLSEKDVGKYDFDYVVCGEGERVFVELVKAIVNEDEVNNEYIVIKRDDEVIMNKALNYVELDYASPLTNDFSEVDVENQIVYLETSRGCPYQCAYCQASLDNKVRNFDVHYIFSLIDLINEREVKLVKFLDRTFNFDVERTNQILAYIISHDNKKTVYQFEITGELLDLSSIRLINEKARHGLFRFEIGVQSTNDKANQAIRRYQNFDKLRQVIQEIQHGNKIILHLDLIAGLPYEDLSSFKKTFDDVFALGTEELQLGFLKLLKGTKLNEYLEQYGYSFNKQAPYEIISNDFLSSDDLDKIRTVEYGLNDLYNHQKAKSLTLYLIDKYQLSPFDFFFELGNKLTKKMQLYHIYEMIGNSTFIKDENDLIELYKNYYLNNKQRQKNLSIVKEKKIILHQLITEVDLVQNEVFSNSCVEKINDNKYFVYLLNKQQYYIIER